MPALSECQQLLLQQHWIPDPTRGFGRSWLSLLYHCKHPLHRPPGPYHAHAGEQCLHLPQLPFAHTATSPHQLHTNHTPACSPMESHRSTLAASLGKDALMFYLFMCLPRSALSYTPTTVAKPLARSNPSALSLNSSQCLAAKANPFCSHSL